jgi:hypothetical protein
MGDAAAVLAPKRQPYDFAQWDDDQRNQPGYAASWGRSTNCKSRVRPWLQGPASRTSGQLCSDQCCAACVSVVCRQTVMLDD